MEVSSMPARPAYRAHDAAALRRRRPKRPLLERHPKLATHVQARLEAKDSPIAIAVELTQGVYPEIGVTVSHETPAHNRRPTS